MAEAAHGHLVGHRFAGVRYTLPEYVCWLWADAIGAEPDPEVAHPSLAYFVAMQGLGASILDVFALFDASADSGVLMGEVELEFNGTLVPGATYDCEARIAAVERKRGARAGAFDRVLLDFRVRAADRSEPVVRCTATWIFPRTGA